MAIITEEQDPINPPKTHKPTSPSPSTSTQPTTTTTPNPFTFWFYFTLSASLITLLSISLSSILTPHDPKTWFLTLPAALRHHYSDGRTIKVQITPNRPSIEVFTLQSGATKSESDKVLIVHGFGCSSYTFRHIVKSLGSKGVRAVAVDLPGSGFSDKSEVVIEVEEKSGGFLGIYNEIKEKGLFWGFDQLVEKGYVNYDEENQIPISTRESVKPIELGPEEMGRVLGQVVDSMGLAPVDLVLHDSALGLGANWVLENSDLVRSVTLLDAASTGTALPLWVLEIPVVREVVLGFGFVFGKVVGWCCVNSAEGFDVEGHRVLLKGRDGRRAVVGMGKKVNGSLDLGEWSGLDGVKALQMQVIWSKEGGGVADALPQAKFVEHSGGRWPGEDTSEELAKSIHRFVSSLPKSIRQAEEEPIPDHIQKMFDEAKNSDHHHHDGHDHGHGHGHAAGYIDAYGLDHGWAS